MSLILANRPAAIPTPEAGPLRCRTCVRTPWTMGGSEIVVTQPHFLPAEVPLRYYSSLRFRVRTWTACFVSHGPPQARLLPALPRVKLADHAPGPRLLETLRPCALSPSPSERRAGQKWEGSYQVQCSRGRCCRDDGLLNRGK